MGQANVSNLGSLVLLKNWGSSVITNWDKGYHILGKVLKISVTVITKWDNYYKLGQTLLRLTAGIIN